MSDQEVNSVALPIDEALIKDAIRKLIREFGMDKLTSRIIRNKLGETFNADFSTHKGKIDRITMEIVKKSDVNTPSEKDEDSDLEKSGSDDGSVLTYTSPKKKNKGTRKRKTSDSDIDSGEVSRKKRRAAAAAAAPKRKKRENGGASKPRKRGVYNKYCALSDDLQSVVGKQYMRRCDVIKAMWTYFKSNNLLDPKDKRYVLCDEPLMKLFKKKRILAFGVMKGLVGHIIEPEFLSEEEQAALEKYAEEEDARRAAAAEDNNNGIQEKKEDEDLEANEKEESETKDAEDISTAAN